MSMMPRYLMIGFAIVMIGIIVMFIGIAILTLAPLLKTPTNVTTGAAGCIVIFFVPICFGTGTEPKLAMVLTAVSLAVALIMVIISLLFIRRMLRVPTQPSFT